MLGLKLKINIIRDLKRACHITPLVDSQIPDPRRCGKTMGVEMVVDNYQLGKLL